MSIQVSAVPADGVWLVAEDVLKCFAKADTMTQGRFKPVDVLNRLQLGHAALFIAFDDSDEQNIDVLACVVCSTASFPRKTDFVIEFLGGKRMDEWVVPMWDLLKQFAKSTGHQSITYTGRKGWLRKVPEFKTKAVYAEVKLDDGQEQ